MPFTILEFIGVTLCIIAVIIFLIGLWTYIVDPKPRKKGMPDYENPPPPPQTLGTYVEITDPTEEELEAWYRHKDPVFDLRKSPFRKGANNTEDEQES